MIRMTRWSVSIQSSLTPPYGTLLRTVSENAAGGVALGSPVRFIDHPAEIDHYSLGGLFDSDSFVIDVATGQLRTKAGVTYDYETKSTYYVNVYGSDADNGANSRIVEVTIKVVTTNEAPLAPGAPSVSALSTDSLRLNWSAPAGGGRPSVSGYRTRYRVSPNGSWRNGPTVTNSRSATLTGLQAGTAYDAQVQATNSNGSGPWSDSGTGSTSEENAVVDPVIPPGTPSISVDPTSLTVTEGDSDGSTFRVALGRVPTGNVTVTIGGHAGTDVSVSSSQLTFTTGNWSSYQTVRVTASHDGDTSNDSVNLTLSASGGGYNSVYATVGVTVTDDDTANRPATGSPSITGITSPLVVSTTLTADTSGISDTDGLSNVSYRYQWVRVGSNTVASISGATGSTYRLQSADVGYQVRVRVSFTDDAGNAESLESFLTSTVVVAGGENPDNGLPTLRLYAVENKISEGSSTHMRVERSGKIDVRVDSGITCTDSSTDELELQALVMKSGVTSKVVGTMVAVNDGVANTNRTITCYLNPVFSRTNNIGSPSSATVRVR